MTDTGHDNATGLIWRDGVPVSTRFDDPYYSLAGGLAEARHVFLSGNDLPGRFRDGFHIAELGFGTGLNLMAAVAAWRAACVPGRLRYTSFEAFPLPPTDMQRAQGHFAELAGLAEELVAHWRAGARHLTLDDLEFTLITGDARDTLPAWRSRADAWFLDGFAPVKNPQMWEPALLAEVGAHTVAGGTAATYSAAGHVRRALAAAGFRVERVPGFGAKRHMTRALMGAE